MVHLKIKTFVFRILLVSVPTYTWSLLVIKWFALRKKWKEAEIFQDRHNCVVMLDRERGLTGYPHWKLSKTNINENMCEPILYFIRTAKKSIDVALMSISSNTIIEELLDAHNRGIKIRLLLDFNYNGGEAMEKLKNLGISVLYYLGPNENVCSIMHYKYSVKDYSEGTGYMCLGSINWVTNSFVNNYENLIFTSNPSMVEDFHANFEESWELVCELQEHDYHVRSMLHTGRYL